MIKSSNENDILSVSGREGGNILNRHKKNKSKDTRMKIEIKIGLTEDAPAAKMAEGRTNIKYD